MIASSSLSSKEIVFAYEKKARAIALNNASRTGSYSVVNILLERGADKNQANEFGQTPLQVAAEAGHMKVVELFMKHGNSSNSLHISPIPSVLVMPGPH